MSAFDLQRDPQTLGNAMNPLGSTFAEVAKRLRSLSDGLSDPADIAAVNTYADELEREAKGHLFKFEDSTSTPRRSSMLNRDLLSGIGFAKHHR